MKKTTLYFLLSLGIYLFALPFASAQKALVRKAAKTNEQLEYIKTIEVLQEVAEKGYKSEDLFKRLGDAHYFNHQMEEAARWYGELMQFNPNPDAEYYFRYAQSLKSLQKYNEADDWMQKFKSAKADDLRSKYYVNSETLIKNLPDKSSRITLDNLGINTPFSDYSSAFYNGELVIASAREEGPRYSWNNQPYLDLYFGRRYEQTQNSFSDALPLKGKVNTRFHESNAAFSSDGTTLYFTRNNYLRGRLRKDDEKFSNLKIYRARFDGTEWTDVITLPINNDDFNTAHPALTPDEKYLVFSSDRPGSIGSSDIYLAPIGSDGTIGQPQLLGKGINTEGRESFPFVDENYNLFFASDGHPGLGGLDIFTVKDIRLLLENPNQEVEVQNMGKPYNSPQDDFAYAANPASGMGYLSSNRSGGVGDDDIYAFPLNCLVSLNGMVVDADTGLAIENSSIEVFDSNAKSLSKMGLGQDALFNIPGDCEDEILVRAMHPDYNANEVRVAFIDFSDDDLLKISLQKDKNKLDEGIDLAKILDLTPIYFDFDKWNIRPDAEMELQKIIVAMEKYPQLKIDVRSHTDSRGNDAYNLALSEKRNRATIQYLIEVGKIDAERLSGRGYGESELLNSCGNGVSCSKEEHQLNRRSEFIIIQNQIQD